MVRYHMVGGSHVYDEVETADLDVTGETFVQAERNSRSSLTSSNTWLDVADTENEDLNDEQDSSLNFDPDETGWYIVSGSAKILSGAAGDEAIIAVRDVDSGSTVQNGSISWELEGNADGQSFCFIVHLTSGTNYKVQATNKTSDFKVEGDDDGRAETVHYTIRRSVVHP